MAEIIESIYALKDSKAVKRGLEIIKENERSHKQTKPADDEEVKTFAGVTVHPNPDVTPPVPSEPMQATSRTKNRSARYRGPGAYKHRRFISRHSVGKVKGFTRQKRGYGRYSRPMKFSKFYRRRR